MKKLLTLALAFVAVALFTAPTVAQPLGGNRPKSPIPRPKIPRQIVLCRDPAAQSLTFQILSRSPEGRIRITGVVRNVGNAVFESDPRQAIVALYETHPGARGTVKAQQSIARLAPNATITLNYELGWSPSSEFPPTFDLLISYDPDIYLDGNLKNDDCNQANNKKALSGEEINRRWLHP